jgi:hypothetical protein
MMAYPLIKPLVGLTCNKGYEARRRHQHFRPIC